MMHTTQSYCRESSKHLTSRLPGRLQVKRSIVSYFDVVLTWQLQARFHFLQAMTFSTDQKSANYRFHCDNDAQNLDGTSRWKVCPDPEHVWSYPAYYWQQITRPRYPASDRDIPYMEFFDSGNTSPAPCITSGRTTNIKVENGMLMGASRGCQSPRVSAMTYLQKADYKLPWKFADLASERATITVCIVLSIAACCLQG